jgi:glycosyltransferase involved in cell wall biosynthesis
MSEPTIGHLVASNFAGGPEKQIVELSTRLRDAGWAAVVGSFRENRPEVEIERRARDRGLSTFLIDTAGSFSPAAVGQLRHWIRSFGFDLLVTHGYKANVIGRLASWGLAPHVPMVRGFTAADWKIRQYERLDRVLLKTAPLVLCVSHATRQILVRHGIREDRIEVLHNAVDCRAVEPLDLRAEFSLPASGRVLVAAGRLSIEKGHRDLVEALARLDDSSVSAVILGSGPEQTALERQIRTAGLTDRVVLGGFRQDVLRCLAGADLVVNPSLTEGLPNVVLEAMSVGTPVVATDVGGVSEIIEHGKTGWLAPAADPATLAGALRRALAPDAPRDVVAVAGQARVKAAFTFEEQARQFQGICRRLLGQRAGHRGGTDHAC